MMTDKMKDVKKIAETGNNKEGSPLVSVIMPIYNAEKSSIFN